VREQLGQLQVWDVDFVVECSGMAMKKRTVDTKSSASSDREAEAHLTGFLAKYTPEIETLAKAARKKLRARLKGASELVYDNYNALAIGYGPSERASDAIISIALYPCWVSLFFLQAKGLRDPGRLLQGSGRVCKHIVLKSAADLDRADMLDLIEQALQTAKAPRDPRAKQRLVIKSVSAKQRPRRPAQPAKTRRG